MHIQPISTLYMYLGIFNFNYSVKQLDALHFMFAYVTCLVVTYYAWKIKTEHDINPLILKIGIIIFIAADIIYESYDSVPCIMFAKLIFTYVSCFWLYAILNKIYNGY